MIESRIANDKRVIFRETFDIQSIAKNGGVITGGVTLENGVATSGAVEFHVKYKPLSDTGFVEGV
jgi:hypothetical protein